ncbi:cytochrome P450 [Mycena crocata]|nr:cytochrome P450 [Mycena crocata]
MVLQPAVPLAATILCYFVLYAVRSVYRQWTSPLRHVGGPKSRNPLLGNFKQLMDDPDLTAKWRSEFGPNFRFKGLFNRGEFHTTDLKAINRIVTNTVIYQRAPSNREAAGRLVGQGLLTTELDVHHRHRRILNPAFGGAQIRDLTGIFIEKAIQLRDIWAHEVELQDGRARIDILSWLRRATLDVIGAAAFGYQFNTLDTSGKPNELNEALTTLFHGPHAALYSAIRAMQGMHPLLALLPLPGGKASREARVKMDTIGAQIVADRKAEIKASEGEKGVPSGRDVLSVLLKANMSPHIPQSQRLSDSEVIGQIPAFFLAGHETTSISTTWILHALSYGGPDALLFPRKKNRAPRKILTCFQDPRAKFHKLAYLIFFCAENVHPRKKIWAVRKKNPARAKKKLPVCCAQIKFGVRAPAKKNCFFFETRSETTVCLPVCYGV